MKPRLNYEEAAAHLGVSVGCLRTWVCRKTVPHVRLSGRVVVFDRVALDAWIAEKTVTAKAAMP